MFESTQFRFFSTLLGTIFLVALCLGMVFVQYWMRDKRRQAERDDRRFELEMKREERRDEIQANVDAGVIDGVAAAKAGPSSGGYIVADLDEQLRPLFHDLLKGFEDYAQLKGYHLSFSIDSTTEGKIAFKFTVRDDGVVVGQERVRRDFKEYLEQVQNKDLDALDDLPIITSLEEHGLLVTLLKNRISFLQHSYKLSQTTIAHYENLLNASRTFPAFPAPSVFVQTGGSMDSRSFSAVNSQKVLQGDRNSLTDNSITMGNSFAEKQQRMGALDDVLQQLKAVPNPNEHTAKAELSLIKVKDELSDEAEPNTPAIKKWLETAKNSLGTAALGYETIEAGRKLFELFGIS